MFKKTRIATEVLSALVALSLITPLQTHAQDEGSQARLEEIVVTASRRSESQQDIPIAVQAFSEKQLNELGIGSLQDYVVVPEE